MSAEDLIKKAFILDDFELMMKLISDGGSVDMVDPRDGSSALHRAVVNNRLDVVDYLIERHVNLNPAMGNNGITPLHLAAIYKHKEIAERLIDAGADINAGDKYGMPPISYVFSNYKDGYLELAKLFLDKGADINSQDIDGVPLSSKESFQQELKKLGLPQ